MAAAPFPLPMGEQMFTDDGIPAAGYALWSTEAGTSNLQYLYSDSALGSAYSNPIILDASGRIGGSVYGLATPAYDLRLNLPTETPAYNDSALWTREDIHAVEPAT